MERDTQAKQQDSAATGDGSQDTGASPMPEDTRMEAGRYRPCKNSLERFDLLMKMAYLPGVLGILKRDS